MANVDVIQVLKDCDALLEGHFLLSSGKHSNRYVQCAKVLRFPDQAEKVLSVVVDKIKDLDIDKVYIAGGTDTISKAAEAKLPKVIERMAGKNRYETSVAIAKSKFQGSKEAFVASGQQFADALVISPISGKYNLPTLLVSSRANGNQEVKGYIKDSKINKLVAIGGHRYIPSSIIDSLVK